MRRQRTVVTVEKLHDGNLLDDPTLAAGCIPGFYVETVAVVPRGAWPLPLPEHYAWDAEHLAGIRAACRDRRRLHRLISTSMCMSGSRRD